MSTKDQQCWPPQSFLEHGWVEVHAAALVWKCCFSETWSPLLAKSWQVFCSASCCIRASEDPYCFCSVH